MDRDDQKLPAVEEALAQAAGSAERIPSHDDLQRAPLELSEPNSADPLIDLMHCVEQEPVQTHSQIVAGPVSVSAMANFHRDLAALVPRAWCTPALAAAIVGMFLTLSVSGVSMWQPVASDFIPWGANFGPKTMNGQWWRLETCTFLHSGAFHLVFNLLALLGIGRLIERLLGNIGFLLACVVTGVAGSLVSLLWNPTVVCVGVSGVVFGLYGILLGFLTRGRGTIPIAVVRELRNSGLSFVGYNLVFSMTASGIDHGAHLGGLAAGLVLGFILGRPLDSRFLATRTIRNVVMAAVGVIGIGSAIAALPDPPRDTGTEAAALANAEREVLTNYAQLIERAQRGQVDDARVADELETEILPAWRRLREGWRSLRSAPGTRADLFDGIDKCLGLREESWEALIHATREQDQKSVARHQEKWAAADSCVRELETRIPGK